MQPVSPFSSLPTGFCTVISGVFIFVGSQFALKGILEPAQELKVKIAEIGKHLDLLTRQPWAVQENNSIIPGNTDPLTQEGRSAADRNNDIREDDIDLINKLSVEMRSFAFRILMYSLIRYPFAFPSRKNLEEAYENLNKLSEKLKYFKKLLQGEIHINHIVKPSNPESRNKIRSKIKTLIEDIKRLLRYPTT